MMFDDIIRFLLVFVFLLAPYAFVFFAVFGGPQIVHMDYERNASLCESALIDCSIIEISPSINATIEALESRPEYKFDGSSDICLDATESCRIVEATGFESFYSLLFSIFRIALVDDGRMMMISNKLSYSTVFLSLSSSNRFI